MERLQSSLDRRKTELLKLNKFKFNKQKDSVDFDFIEDKATKALSNNLVNLSIESNQCSVKNDLKDGINLIKVDKLISNRFLNDSSPALRIPEKFGFRSIVTHSLAPPIIQNTQKEPLNLNMFGNKKFILQLFFRGNPFTGEIYSQDLWISIINQLQSNQSLLALFIYGSIYSWKQLSKVLEPSIPAFFSPGQMPLAQEKLLERLFNVSSLDNENVHIHEPRIEFTN